MTEPQPTEKFCAKCKTTKPLSDFYRYIYNPSRDYRYCLTCINQEGKFRRLLKKKKQDRMIEDLKAKGLYVEKAPIKKVVPAPPPKPKPVPAPKPPDPEKEKRERLKKEEAQQNRLNKYEQELAKRQEPKDVMNINGIRPVDLTDISNYVNKDFMLFSPSSMAAFLSASIRVIKQGSKKTVYLEYSTDDTLYASAQRKEQRRASEDKNPLGYQREEDEDDNSFR